MRTSPFALSFRKERREPRWQVPRYEPGEVTIMWKVRCSEREPLPQPLS
jgi:hypothetical protein